VGRVLILAIALRGTQPSERPAIIHALTDFVHAVRKSNQTTYADTFISHRRRSGSYQKAFPNSWTSTTSRI
jgi:hypothetical protein